tara:strand:- start:5822 stop:7540 length:1719 start_codon:yes stop_codon:yes gene_type:complete
MKWIGQHVWDYISRFRNDVYLESISSGTIASGGNLGLDSNNKIVKAAVTDGDITGVTAGTGLSGGGTSGAVTLNVSGLTISEIAGGSLTTSSESFADNDTTLMTSAAINDRIESFGYTTNTGDITGVTITTDSGGGSKAEDDSGSADFSILGDEGIGITNSGTTITAVAIPGEIDHDSLLNFADNEHFTQANITTVGTIGTGVWQGTAIASAYLDSDTAHLSGTQTFSGAKTFSAATTTFTSATADSPLIKVLNTTDDDQAGQLVFEKLRDDDAVASGQNLGEIWFKGQDNAQNTQAYAAIIAKIDVSTGGQESGKINFHVVAHDGSTRTAMSLTGGSEAVEVDATIGLGANSVVTIPGNIDLAGDIDVDGTMEADAITLGGTAIGDLYSPVVGHTSITRVGTIDTGTWQGTAIASAYLDADTMHYSAQRQLTHHMFKDDIDTTKHYIGLQEADAEQTNTSNKNLPFLAPVAGKLLKVFLRANSDLSGKEFTWRLETRASSASTFGSPSVIGTQSGNGCTASSMATYDFTSSLDDGTNVISAGDQVLLSIQSDASTGDHIYLVTCMWEWDLS